ncbi:MAG: hypothetical protein KatS3mg008_1331 [Acidimicrobiales bacterium]|nr:MAG: hypothetical protein KatS3mg008_1331 [Acidimicrobiales bacterium]
MKQPFAEGTSARAHSGVPSQLSIPVTAAASRACLGLHSSRGPAVSAASNSPDTCCPNVIGTGWDQLCETRELLVCQTYQTTVESERSGDLFTDECAHAATGSSAERLSCQPSECERVISVRGARRVHRLRFGKPSHHAVPVGQLTGLGDEMPNAEQSRLVAHDMS